MARLNFFRPEPEEFEVFWFKLDGVEGFELPTNTTCRSGLKSDSNRVSKLPGEEGRLPSHVKLREWECGVGELKYDPPLVSSPHDSGGNEGVSDFFFLRRKDGALDSGPGLDTPPKA